MEIVLADVVAGIEDVREFALHVRRESILQGLDDSAGSEVGAADADHHDHLRKGGHAGSTLLNTIDFVLGHIVRQGDPSEKVVAAAGLVQRSLQRGLRLRFQVLNLLILNSKQSVLIVESDIHNLSYFN